MLQATTRCTRACVCKWGKPRAIREAHLGKRQLSGSPPHRTRAQALPEINREYRLQASGAQ